MEIVSLVVLLGIISGVLIAYIMHYSGWIEWKIENGKLLEYKTDWLTTLKRILKKRTKEEDARRQGIYL